MPILLKQMENLEDDNDNNDDSDDVEDVSVHRLGSTSLSPATAKTRLPLMEATIVRRYLRRTRSPMDRQSALPGLHLCKPTRRC
jgi:hypothetical protein